MPDPAALLRRLNDLLHDDLPADRFITFVVAVLDEAGRTRLVSAGHGPTLLSRAASGEVTEFGGDGVPLGVIPGEEYGPTNELSLDEGEVLVMFTDGYFEWARPADREAFGIRRLHDTLRGTAHGDAATILRTLDETVRRFCDGSPQSDDMTAIVIKRNAPAVAKQPPAPPSPQSDRSPTSPDSAVPRMACPPVLTSDASRRVWDEGPMELGTSPPHADRFGAIGAGDGPGVVTVARTFGLRA